MLLVRLAKIKKSDNSKCEWGGGNIAGGSINKTATLKNCLVTSSKIEDAQTRWPRNSSARYALGLPYGRKPGAVQCAVFHITQQLSQMCTKTPFWKTGGSLGSYSLDIVLFPLEYKKLKLEIIDIFWYLCKKYNAWVLSKDILKKNFFALFKRLKNKYTLICLYKNVKFWAKKDAIHFCFTKCLHSWKIKKYIYSWIT